MVQCKDNTLADSVSDDGVDVLGVLLPLWFLLVELYSVVDLLKQLVDCCSAVFYVEKLLGDGSLEDVVILLR